jgi:predicted AAA+ superfamily ATPase
MPISDEQLLELNPWWRDARAIESDPKVRAFEARRFRWDPPVLDALEVGVRRVHTLRGPRQVGKSTTAKRLVRRLLRSGERRVLYFPFDLSKDNADIVDVVRRARRLHPEPSGPWFLFLDEVTGIVDWQLAVKYIVDNGPADEDFILCTGSSARKVGSEQLPGRRGAGRHYVQLPVSFRDFCRQGIGIEVEQEAITPGRALTPEGLGVLRRMYLGYPELTRAWQTYSETGGFPSAIEDHLIHGSVQDRTIEMLWDIVAGDVRDLGRNAVATLKLLERVMRSQGAPLSWHSLAQDMEVSQPTAKAYVRVLAESFMLLVLFSWDAGGRGLSPQKQRKIYFIDPLLARIPRLLVPGISATDGRGAIREALVANALFRSATDRLVQADPVMGALCFWKSGRGTEVDFMIAEKAPGLPGRRLPIEVKGDSRASIANARKSLGQAFGGGIVLTDSVFQPDDAIPAIPAAVFVASLEERPVRTPMEI